MGENKCSFNLIFLGFRFGSRRSLLNLVLGREKVSEQSLGRLANRESQEEKFKQKKETSQR